MVGYAGRKILVTGGTGFVGGRLAERLVFEEHARVRVLVRDWRKAVWVSRTDVELVHGDVRDVDAVAQAMQGCDIVFHCVGVGGPLDYCVSINIEGTRNVLECAANAGVGRVVYLSTCGVHGPNPPDNTDDCYFHARKLNSWVRRIAEANTGETVPLSTAGANASKRRT